MEDTAGKDSLAKLDREQYLAMLPDADRSNLQRIIELFGQVTQELGRSASLIAVGGTLTKPLPRKDIDLLVIFDKSDSDPKKQDYPDYHQFAVADFQILNGLISGIVAADPSFTIKEIIEPAIDEEFQNPSILKHDGSISLKSQSGAELEFIRIVDRGSAQEVFTAQSRPNQPLRPYVVLT